MPECSCKEWKEYASEIDGAITLAWTHGMWTDNDITFKFCPWCGNEL